MNAGHAAVARRTRLPRGAGLAAVLAAALLAPAAGAQDAALFREAFEDAALASRGWYDNTSQDITTAEHLPWSTASIQYRFPLGAVVPVTGLGIRRLFPGQASVYLSYWVRYSANWTGSNRPYHPHEFNLLTDRDSQWVGPASTRLTFYVEQNEGEPLLAIQDSENIDEANIGTNLVGVTEFRGVAGCNGDGDGHGPGDCYRAGARHRNGKAWRAGSVLFDATPGPRYQGDWHFVEAYFRLNTLLAGVGVPDGAATYRLDGETVFDHQDVLLRTGEHPAMLVNQLMIGPYIGDGSPVDQTFWVDDLTVAAERVGDLLRNDEVISLSPLQPPLAQVFRGNSLTSLDPAGPDLVPQIGEGGSESQPGSADDDDTYLRGFLPGAADPDGAPDPSRPLVFYELLTPGATLRLSKDAGGGILVTW